jgi:hypothetical protein
MQSDENQPTLLEDYTTLIFLDEHGNMKQAACGAKNVQKDQGLHRLGVNLQAGKSSPMLSP